MKTLLTLEAVFGVALIALGLVDAVQGDRAGVFVAGAGALLGMIALPRLIRSRFRDAGGDDVSRGQALSGAALFILIGAVSCIVALAANDYSNRAVVISFVAGIVCFGFGATSLLLIRRAERARHEQK